MIEVMHGLQDVHRIFFLRMKHIMKIVERSLLICKILGLPIPKRYMQFQRMNPTFFHQICLQVTRTLLDLYDEYVHLGGRSLSRK